MTTTRCGSSVGRARAIQYFCASRGRGRRGHEKELAAKRLRLRYQSHPATKNPAPTSTVGSPRNVRNLAIATSTGRPPTYKAEASARSSGPRPHTSIASQTAASTANKETSSHRRALLSVTFAISRCKLRRTATRFTRRPVPRICNLREFRWSVGVRARPARACSSSKPFAG